MVQRIPCFGRRSGQAIVATLGHTAFLEGPWLQPSGSTVSAHGASTTNEEELVDFSGLTR